MPFYSGKNLKVRLNGFAHKCEEVECEDEVEEMETTNSESTDAQGNGFFECEDSNVSKLTMTVRGQYDVGATPLVRMKPGSLISNVVVYPAGTAAGASYVVPSFRVRRCRTSAAVKGKVPFEMTGVNNGSYTRPTV